MQYKKKKKRAHVETYNPEKWEVEEDLRSLGRAFCVKKDPERMKKVKALAKQKIDENKRKKEEAEHMVELGEGTVET